LEANVQRDIARQIVAKGLSVRQTEALVRVYQEGKKDAKVNPVAAPSADIRRLENSLSEKLGAAVEIQQGTKGKGKLVISYNSLDELDGILVHIQ
jgi:ParB family chromosome partitioning protein